MSSIALPRPNLTKMTEDRGTTKFTLSNLDVALANAIRRTILTDLPVIAVRTESNAINQCKVEVNTGQMHNEMLLQRISCVPVHSMDAEFCDQYQLELDVSNTEDVAIHVTTEQFRLRDLRTGQLIAPEQSQKTFPPSPITSDYIHLLTLQPAIGAIPGEKIKLTARFQWTSAAENGMFIAACASYGYTQDVEKSREEWTRREAELQASDAEESDIVAAKSDFYNLDAARYFVPNSFDFSVQSIGVYGNLEAVQTACEHVRRKLGDLVLATDSNMLPVFRSTEARTVGGYDSIIESSMLNSYDIILENLDETVGNILAYAVLALYYKNSGDENEEDEISYCGHKKIHPHDTYSMLRIALTKDEPMVIARVLKHACSELERVLADVQKLCK